MSERDAERSRRMNRRLRVLLGRGARALVAAGRRRHRRARPAHRRARRRHGRRRAAARRAGADRRPPRPRAAARPHRRRARRLGRHARQPARDADARPARLARRAARRARRRDLLAGGEPARRPRSRSATPSARSSCSSIADAAPARRVPDRRAGSCSGSRSRRTAPTLAVTWLETDRAGRTRCSTCSTRAASAPRLRVVLPRLPEPDEFVGASPAFTADGRPRRAADPVPAQPAPGRAPDRRAHGRGRRPRRSASAATALDPVMTSDRRRVLVTSAARTRPTSSTRPTCASSSATRPAASRWRSAPTTARSRSPARTARSACSTCARRGPAARRPPSRHGDQDALHARRDARSRPSTTTGS